MSTFRKSQLTQIYDCINENAVDIVSNVGEANYLQEYQAGLYIEGRMATAVREVYPIGPLRVSLHRYRDSHEFGKMTYEIMVTVSPGDTTFVHGVRVVANYGLIHDNLTLPKTTYTLSEMSSHEYIQFEKTVHTLGEEVFREHMGDTKLSSSELIEAWESSMAQRLLETFGRGSFEVALTVSHGAEGISLVGTVEDLDEHHEVTMEVKGERFLTEDEPTPVSKLGEVIISLEPEPDLERAQLRSKITAIASAELVNAYLTVEDKLPSEIALYAIQAGIQHKLTQELNTLRFSVVVSYYTPLQSVNVAVVEETTSLAVSVVALRQRETK